jgi:hypothetical protein
MLSVTRSQNPARFLGEVARNPVASAAAASTKASRLSGSESVFEARAATPAPDGGPDKAYDGFLVGGNGKTSYPPGTRLEDVPAIRPNNGKQATETIIFVNGIGESRASGANARHLQEIANSTGQNVVGLYNATEGTLNDLVQALKDKKDLGTNHAVDSLAQLVYGKLKSGEGVHLMGHSHGALVSARALEDVKNRLMLEDGMSKQAAESLLSKVKVETMGGASAHFTDGPRYVHYVNRADLVPMAFGLGRAGSDPGRGAKVVKFGFPNPFGIFGDAHNTGTYFKHWKPFDNV